MMHQPDDGRLQQQKDAVADTDSDGGYYQRRQPDDREQQEIEGRGEDAPIAEEADSRSPEAPDHPAREQNGDADDDAAAFVVHLRFADSGADGRVRGEVGDGGCDAGSASDRAFSWVGLRPSAS